MLAVGCDSDIEPATPQENPQEPIMTAGDVISEADGPIKESVSPEYVLNLNDYNTETTGVIPVVTIGEAKNLPSGASIGYELELSDTETFARSVKVEVLGNLSSETPDTYYVATNEWNDAHLYLFGKSPKEKTVYYRMPVYINLDGSNYRYESTDYYAFSGSLNEICVDSGFVIEDAYYFLSNATSWDLGKPDVMAEYAFYHNPDVSPYDDPVFTYIFTVTQEILDNNGGGCYWKIAPKSKIGTDDWDHILGTEVNGDSSLEGFLVSEKPQSGMVTETGRYQISINMESMTYKITHLENVVYLIGAPSGWNINNGTMYLSETADGTNIYTGVVRVDAGNFGFRFYSQLGNWDTNSIGAKNDNDDNLDVTFVNGVFEGDVYQAGVNCTNGKGNWQSSDWAGGALEITLDLNTNKITMKETSVNSGIYLRGGMNGWGAEAAYEFILSNKVSVWEIADVTITSGTEFKVADKDWNPINYGVPGGGTAMPDVPLPLTWGDSNNNIKMGADFTGKAELTLSDGQYTLTLVSK